MAQCLVTLATEGWFDFIDICGREGRIDSRSSNWLRYEISVSSKSMAAYEQPTRISPRLWGDPIMMMLVPELEEFAAAMEENRQPAITALLPYLERDLDPELRFAVAAKLGVGLGRSGRYAEALRAYEIAAQLEPRNPDVQRGLASARRLLAVDITPPAPPPRRTD